MANELNFFGNTSQSGLTVFARLYDAQANRVGDDIPCPELSQSAIYSGNVTVLNAGIYNVQFFAGSDLVGQGQLDWDGAQEIMSTEIKAKLDKLFTYSALDPSAPVKLTRAAN